MSQTSPAQPTDAVTQRMRDALKLHLVQRHIFCPVNGQVLDVRSCVVLVDVDGDPAGVLSQDGYQTLVNEHPDRLEALAAKSITVDASTVTA